jgi:hypothetical protein
MTWSSGPGLGGWAEHHLDTTCRWWRREHNAVGAQTCEAQLGCDDQRGGRALTALLSDPVVLRSFGVDFGARDLSAIDRPTQSITALARRIWIPECTTPMSCPDVPRAVLDLFALAMAESDHFETDGGARKGLALHAKRCR